ncbi:MAG TPA: tetratricopeptide repeat protein [Candidatus Krumholzibacteria bacterium]|nr:tetratricopeptide repeat protein [Candidatus Krumholzibacteria bacterium]HPD71452.1 tetratricopeptide repeat protein [Candidatus Krumholzibacteria bacterium]HRY41615.1 tetratricopeptide repeat protein [Candidatus Krumholzibacteria bacterium]
MSSTLRKLKQQAYEAGRKRDWAQAAEAYAEILEMDKSNPSLQNEYGDVCLKAGDTAKAIRQFLSAAAKYRQTGLLNNAQAVYKKVLRYDAGNLNANWFLAEIRSTQGLIADGEQHAIAFLEAAEGVSGEIKEIFLKRCLEIFTLFPESDAVLEKVEGIFRIWDLRLESARAGCLRARLAWQAGRCDEAAAAVARLVEGTPEITNYAEYGRWLETTGRKAKPAGFTDVNTVHLERAADAAPPAAATEAPAAAGEDPAEPAGGRDADVPADSDDLARDEDGCISLDAGDEADVASLVDGAARSFAAEREASPAAEAEPAAHDGTPVNLLDEILAEEGEDILRSSEAEQVSTIASEIGRNLGETADADPEVLYQQGLVYLEMGLYDQAVIALAAAARSARHAVQAREMWGIALHRAGRVADALKVLEDGLAKASGEDRAALGLRYHAGRILEDLGRDDEAQAHYRRVHAIDAGFADVAQRLRLPVA